MKLLWAVCALLLSCWRASASTGKNVQSAMLAEDFALFQGVKTNRPRSVRLHEFVCVLILIVTSPVFFYTAVASHNRLPLSSEAPLSGSRKPHLGHFQRRFVTVSGTIVLLRIEWASSLFCSEDSGVGVYNRPFFKKKKCSYLMQNIWRCHDVACNRICCCFDALAPGPGRTELAAVLFVG